MKLDELSTGSLRFRSTVEIASDRDTLSISCELGRFSIHNATPSVRHTMQRLIESRVSVDELDDGLESNDRKQIVHILGCVDDLLVLGLCDVRGRTLLEIEPLARKSAYQCDDIPVNAPIQLSPFSVMRTFRGSLVLESPLSRNRVIIIEHEIHTLLGALGSIGSVAKLSNSLGAAITSRILSHLVGAGFVEVGTNSDGSVVFPSETDPDLRQWEFHDLLSHSRARSGRYDGLFGGVYPFRGEIEPRAAIKSCPDGLAIPLPRPTLDEVVRSDSELVIAMEARRSVRKYGNTPIDAKQLGEFLYRTARVRASSELTEVLPYEVTTRPYPNGGAAYELELYLTIKQCDGIKPGIYYYDPVNHQLILVNDSETDLHAMLLAASRSTGLSGEPPMLITMTARFGRLSWKYRRIAYSVILRNTGVLYQSMYLVATSMRLAPCGLGSGDSELSGRVLGLDYLSESSVGEFLLGPLPVIEHESVEVLDGVWVDANDSDWTNKASARLRAIDEVR